MGNLTHLLTEKEKRACIDTLTPELVLLRNKAGISQDELSSLIGVSRQTYGAIERRARRMSWGTFLALVMYFDYNQKTHQLLRSIGAYPYDMIKCFNGGSDPGEVSVNDLAGGQMQSIVSQLDDQALCAIRTMIMVEYARCTGTPGDVVVKAFNGVNFTLSPADNATAKQALNSIREKKHRK